MILVEDAQHFQFFAGQVKGAIERYGTLNDKTLLTLQQERVDGLSALELEFRTKIQEHPKAKEAFDVFYDEVLVNKKNLLAARPYFRERHDAFANGIMESIRNRDYRATCKFHFNYHLIALIVTKTDFGPDSELPGILKKIMDIRQDLVLMNLPLVISRARVFFSKTPKSHLSFMDLVQIGVGGLISAIDKYCGEYTRVWRSVVIGRQSGDQIRDYSETMIHFYPDDKRRLYRANKFLARKMEGDYKEEELLKVVNDDSQCPVSANVERPKATTEELRQLLMAATTVSCDTRPPLDDENVGEENINRLPSPNDFRPDLSVEKSESLGIMYKCIESLSVMDKKILRMKGLDI